MIEPMLTDLAEAVRRLSAAEQPSWAGPWQPVTSVSAVTSIGSHEVQMVRHACATGAWRSSRSQAAAAAARSRHIICAQHEGFHGLHAHQPARIGRQRPPEARVARAHLRARADHPEYAEFYSVWRAQQAHANARPMPACGPVVVARLRREPRSHAVDGLARPDATDRSHLHSRKDTCTFARHAGLELR